MYNVRQPGEPALCSLCDPRLGKWHEAFPRRAVTVEQIERGAIINRKPERERMGVRITADEGVVALFDSTSGVAFGPVFDSAFDAELFLKWADKEKEVEDLRALKPGELADLMREWDDNGRPGE
jgi:hypothetical protein